MPIPETRTSPMFTTLDYSKNAYADFWDYANMRTEEIKMYLNDDMFGQGVPLPFWKLSFLTKFEFSPHNMDILAELYYNKVIPITPPAPTEDDDEDYL